MWYPGKDCLLATACKLREAQLKLVKLDNAVYDNDIPASVVCDTPASVVCDTLVCDTPASVVCDTLVCDTLATVVCDTLATVVCDTLVCDTLATVVCDTLVCDTLASVACRLRLFILRNYLPACQVRYRRRFRYSLFFVFLGRLSSAD